MQEMKPIKEGKVREIYDNGDSLIMVATDRISCFDVILKNEITKKGTVLTQMSKFWFDLTEDILPNHMLSVDVKDMPEYFQQEKFDGNSMMCRKLEMLPIECIVRGYITGSGWASYQKTGKVCGIELPEGLKESDKLPEPIYTPSTKAEIGDHDENISYEQSIEHLEKQFPGKGQEYAEKLRDYTIALYKKCAEYALSKGIIIADTKFEFGLDEEGNPCAEVPCRKVQWPTSCCWRSASAASWLRWFPRPAACSAADGRPRRWGWAECRWTTSVPDPGRKVPTQSCLSGSWRSPEDKVHGPRGRRS